MFFPERAGDVVLVSVIAGDVLVSGQLKLVFFLLLEAFHGRVKDVCWVPIQKSFMSPSF